MPGRIVRSRGLAYSEMLDVVQLVEGEATVPTEGRENSKSLCVAHKLIQMKRNPQTRGQAQMEINRINRKIIIKNRMKSNLREGKRLYQKLMAEE